MHSTLMLLRVCTTPNLLAKRFQSRKWHVVQHHWLLTHHVQFSSINANTHTCITHQLNIDKCITKQYHEMKIEYLSFICFMGRFHLDHYYLSSSTFMKSSFLMQMIRWIRGSSRIEFFIFLIAWEIFFDVWAWS